VIDAETGVTRESVPEILPECIDALARMQRPQGIGPALRDKIAIGVPHLGPQPNPTRNRLLLAPLPGHPVILTRPSHVTTLRDPPPAECSGRL
jgi:hypothetical protein